MYPCTGGVPKDESELTGTLLNESVKRQKSHHATQPTINKLLAVSYVNCDSRDQASTTTNPLGRWTTQPPIGGQAETLRIPYSLELTSRIQEMTRLDQRPTAQHEQLSTPPQQKNSTLMTNIESMKPGDTSSWPMTPLTS